MDGRGTFFELAFDRAFAQIGITSPNPAVGAVVVKDGVPVSSGGTQVCGGDHAEICAITAAGDACAGADLYVTLEPCCHHGKTPPCTDAIIKAKIRRVFIPVEDPNPKVSGKGVQVLREAGVDVIICDEFRRRAVSLLRPFFSRVLQQRPHLLYKAAFSADGCTATRVGDSKWISSEPSRYMVHRLRALVDAVIIGKHTVETDNPLLDCRLKDFPASASSVFSSQKIVFSDPDNAFLTRLAGSSFDNEIRSPLRVCVGLPNLSAQYNFFRDTHFVAVEKMSRLNLLYDAPGFESLPSMVEAGRVVPVPDSDNMSEFVMDLLYKKGCSFVMLEGGAKAAGSFLSSSVVDEVLFFIAPKLIGGGLPVTDGEGVVSVADASPLSDVSVAMCGGDLVYHGYCAKGRNE